MQDNWRWCPQCQGLFFAGNSRGSCPNGGLLGGPHSFAGSGNYSLHHNEPGDGRQSNWHWCTKCQGLVFGGNNTAGRCPAGAGHDLHLGSDYSLPTEGGAGRQTNWHWCRKCQGLFFRGNSLGRCPAGDTHETPNEGTYGLLVGPTAHPVRAEHLVTWQSFDGHLQDDCDKIHVEMRETNGPTRVRLRSGPQVRGRKRIKVLAGDGALFREHSTTGHNQTTADIEFPGGAMTAVLVLGKQKLNPFDSHDMYQLSTIDVRNRDYTFTWLQDACH